MLFEMSNITFFSAALFILMASSILNIYVYKMCTLYKWLLTLANRTHMMRKCMLVI